jgi:glucokinase
MPTFRWILCLDVGGTGMSAAVFREDGGAPVARTSVPTPVEKGVEGVVDAAANLIRLVRARAEEEGIPARRIVGVGAGFPGAVDPDRGVVRQAPNLRWRDVPIRDLLQERIGLPVVVDNDANCAALGEWWEGAGRGSRFFVAVTLGTGIGGGILDDGRVLRGASGAAGEIGHLSIDFQGRPCVCGNRGCLEAYCAGPAIAARARGLLATRESSSLTDLSRGYPDRITAAMVTEAARGGDALALEVITETGELLGSGIASLVNVLNPDRIVFTGGVAGAGDLLLRPLREEVRRRAFSDSAEACVLTVSREPELAGLRGAALAFRRETLEGS